MDSISKLSKLVSNMAVVFCTNKITTDTRRALQSIMASSPAPFLVVIVDQAESSATDLLRKFQGRNRVVHIHHEATGLSRARNIGTAAAEAAGAVFAAYTDDDCTVDTGWLSGFASSFANAADVALVFGSTKAAPHDSDMGTIPAYVVTQKSIRRGVASKPLIEGMGACMAVRIDAWRFVGGFDDRLGVGTPLAAAEENDLSVRLLRAGFAISETPAAEVIHHGFRNRLFVPLLMAGYMRGSGAATAKMLRLGGSAAICALFAIAKRWIAGRAGVQMGHLPPRRTRLINFLRGMITGLKMKIDENTGRFLPFSGPDDYVRGEGKQSQ